MRGGVGQSRREGAAVCRSAMYGVRLLAMPQVPAPAPLPTAPPPLQLYQAYQRRQQHPGLLRSCLVLAFSGLQGLLL